RHGFAPGRAGAPAHRHRDRPADGIGPRAPPPGGRPRSRQEAGAGTHPAHRHELAHRQRRRRPEGCVARQAGAHGPVSLERPAGHGGHCRPGGAGPVGAVRYFGSRFRRHALRRLADAAADHGGAAQRRHRPGRSLEPAGADPRPAAAIEPPAASHR
ncbi:hypothetical protein OY671_011982, partial [Metschnikowia pulcherrima]